jgi:hypothetical protein
LDTAPVSQSKCGAAGSHDESTTCTIPGDEISQGTLNFSSIFTQMQGAKRRRKVEENEGLRRSNVDRWNMTVQMTAQ